LRRSRKITEVIKMFWDTKALKEIDEINRKIDLLEKAKEINDEKMTETALKIERLLATKPDTLSTEEKARLADLEVKMAKLWGLLVETTPLGKDKLSKYGKKFGGKSGL